MKNFKELIQWTHYYEVFPGCAIQAIIIKEKTGLFKNKTQIFTNEGDNYLVNPNHLIEI